MSERNFSDEALEAAAKEIGSWSRGDLEWRSAEYAVGAWLRYMAKEYVGDMYVESSLGYLADAFPEPAE